MRVHKEIKAWKGKLGWAGSVWKKEHKKEESRF